MGQSNSEQQRVLQLLGLIRRAGQLVTGSELVLRGIQKEQVNYVFVASDSSATTRKQFTDKCNSHKIELSFDFNRTQLSVAIGIQRSVVAVTGKGFSKKIAQLLK
ncbi:L7Ae/L30e/S12e/Gadd45 family ribosomal protein [Liquorilactobacillus satsumensis]|uniref:Ribosomal protein eL8/eL30/eS12/Gadd45 domain-containing protein n=1 Tax=Liquorilactobacillus satsumensis DSM 16230 = JCM 12392 TaxID=1423801 RepID=A0A0R1V1A0_9LACO|nr:ribosomal L7Ae/L30e/S12e/Gadd45 family protein [Liquorilactobacillus satsumensis]KRL99417.1 hypothetical protein FD50_GL000112 [Liquorilactobacillus satsumensis DSM 16230 = JCM 12392]MCC7665893.1 hypothetical protein [Liquorilactobacillus satsumensis]MCP9312147.1 ribosomal L7Ae/L30e/S12e/Gadd45 family protein [Liquorilactobacillus satsumensis]MCP9327766.1 ribosomal L7Ae/L30e/S12e/Gadd45 family protein [Liquorilactobacillus satsumensis]MCP9356600.1 ribosomal L7Ae/L30e/S12e/Gadd45 family prot